MSHELENGEDMKMENLSATSHHIVMDESYLQAHDVIQRFIRHALQPDELQAFEISLIANPALIERIEIQRLVNAAFKQQLTAGKHSNAFLLQYLSPLLRKVLPVAAVLVLGVFIGLKAFDQPESPAADARVFTANTLMLENFRGSVQENIIELSELTTGTPASSKVLLPLRIDVGPQLVADQRYQLQLIGQDKKSSVLAKADALAATSEGWLEYSLELPADVRGHYQLQISLLPINEGGNNEQQNYLFNFR